MIVELPFAYAAEYVPPRARNPRQVTVLDNLPLNIRELDERDFPLAARFADRLTALRWQQVDEIRWDGRSHYRPYVCDWADRRFYVPRSEFLERIQGYHGEQPFRSFQRVPEARYHNTEILTHEAVTTAGRIISDNRQERVAALVGLSARVVLSGDKIWVACGEPAWEVSRSGHITAEAVLADARALAERAEYLARADRLDDYTRVFLPGVEVRAFGTIEILMPETLSLAPEGPHLRARAARAAKQMADYLAAATREEFGLYADLRDALDHSTEGEPADDLAIAVRAVLDHETALLQPSERKVLALAYEYWRAALIRDSEPSLDALPADGLRDLSA